MKEYRTPNLAKACHVINYISDAQGECQLKHIASDLEIPRTTALRITQTLLDVNYLAQNKSGGFTLGPALVQLGVKALDHLDIRAFARPILRALTADTGEASHLAMLNGDKSLLIEVADTPHPVRIASRPGTLIDLHCSSTGKIFLAYSIADPGRFSEALELTPHTKHTHSTTDAILAEIENTRRRGYAIDEEEYVLGARCIAAPVTNAFGKTIAAVGITGSCSTLTKAKTAPMAKKLLGAAAKISAALGCSH